LTRGISEPDLTDKQSRTWSTTVGWTDEQLTDIYDRTSGYCHLCGKKLAFSNYASHGTKGAWEVEHSVPKACGGTDRLSNLYAACISCNRQKKATSTRACRAGNGRTRAPMGRAARRTEKLKSAVAGGGIGALLGAPFGPIGVILGTAIGSHLGHKENPDN
jgi:hypothetical protein